MTTNEADYKMIFVGFNLLSMKGDLRAKKNPTSEVGFS